MKKPAKDVPQEEAARPTRHTTSLPHSGRPYIRTRHGGLSHCWRRRFGRGAGSHRSVPEERAGR